jgi:PAS domain S-box-containing protein
MRRFFERSRFAYYQRQSQLILLGIAILVTPLLGWQALSIEKYVITKQGIELEAVWLLGAFLCGLVIPFLLPLAIALAHLTGRRAKKHEASEQALAAEIPLFQSSQEILRESQPSQLPDFLNNANILIYTAAFDDGCLLYVNRAWCETLGYTQDECSSLSIFHLIHSSQVSFCKEWFKLLQAGRENLKTEMIVLTKDGNAIALEGSLNCQYENGKPKAATGIFRDITKRRRAEHRLETQYITARVLAESATLDEATPKILQAICDNLGWDVGELWSVNQQANWLDFVKVWYQPSIELPEFEAVTRSITFAPGIGLPGRIWESGKPIWIADVVKDTNFLRTIVAEKAGIHGAFGFPILGSKEVLGVLTFLSHEIRQPDSDLLEMITAIGRQIGQFIERKQAEEALSRQRQWLEVTLSSIGDAVIATDTKAAITFMNPVAEALTGWTQEEALGQNIEAVFHIINEVTQTAAEIPVARVLQEGIVVELAENTVLIAKDGREIPIDDSCAPIRDKSGILQGAVLIFRDISKRKQAEAEIRKALKEEKELNELKSRFVSMTSHEFRTPLTTILGSAELIEHYGHRWSEEKKLNHLHRIQTHVKHLTRLLEDVLLIGKSDAGRLEFNPAPLDLEKFCLNLVEELQLNASDRHTLDFVNNAPHTQACMDEKLLRHIFSNLLSNAIKYSPEGGTIHFKFTCQDGDVIFQIRDEGIGIPLDDQKRLFESFHRATNVGKIHGTGLGLSIVKRAVDLHGGKIKVNSEVGMGTTFTVTLPLKQDKKMQ